MSAILEAHGPAERPQRIESAGEILARHFGAIIANEVNREIVEYSQRNKISTTEIHVNLTSFRNRNNIVNVEISREANGTPIIGYPKRQFRIEVNVKGW